MAATAVYARVAAIPTAESRYIDAGFACSNVSADQSFKVTIGGLFMFNVKASNYGTVALQALLPDDTTYAAVEIQTGTASVTSGTVAGTAASFAADGSGLVWLAAGSYRIHLA